MAFKWTLKNEVVAVDSATLTFTLLGGPSLLGIDKGRPTRKRSFLRPEEQAFSFLIYNVYFSEEIRQCGWAATGFIAYTNLRRARGRIQMS